MPLIVTGGRIRLQLDTWNPSALVPGDSFFGSEIVTHQVFARGEGLAFRARVRLVAPLPGGLVGSLFGFAFDAAAGVRDEIDFELLSNDVVAARERVLTNVFDDEDFTVPGNPVFTSLPGLDPTAWNEFEIRWLPDWVRWFVNGTPVREETVGVPDAPMPVRLGFWAPDANFADAFDASLQPADNVGDNEVFFYEVAYVLLNARKHWKQRTRRAPPVRLDEASSGVWFEGWRRSLRGPAPHGPPEVSGPHTWLLRRGWRRYGLIDPAEVPGLC